MRAAAVLLAAGVLAGCGSSAARPRLPRALAATWRADADAVAVALHAGNGCLARRRASRLQASIIAAVNAHRVRPELQETLVGAVNDLATRIRCAG